MINPLLLFRMNIQNNVAMIPQFHSPGRSSIGELGVWLWHPCSILNISRLRVYSHSCFLVFKITHVWIKDSIWMTGDQKFPKKILNVLKI